MELKIPLVLIFCGISFVNECHSKPTETLNANFSGSELAVTQLQGGEDAKEDAGLSKRLNRSPDYGLLNYGDYDDVDSEYSEELQTRRTQFGRKHKHHRKPHGLVGNGCRGFGCGGGGGYYPDYHEPVGQGGSFATASAGSTGGGGYHGGSEANAQSASFSFGPYTASFSIAQASSGANKF